ncbi:MAG TPA: hypothetical protein VK436_05260 [Methanocella sp.]|nr:hypothetical protein [Methanocella sp.]
MAKLKIIIIGLLIAVASIALVELNNAGIYSLPSTGMGVFTWSPYDTLIIFFIIGLAIMVVGAILR